MIDDLLKATREERWPEATELLYRHWVSTSQTVYPAHLDRPWEAGVDETKIANELLYPLAAMFCAESAPTSMQQEDDETQPLDCSLRKLEQIVDIDESKGRSGQICGRMFKNGEPNYSCKECATDGTCVLCYECFVNSAHINHKYKMHTSLGSGYCDCGDKEAWSSDYACKLHMPRVKEEEDEMSADATGLPPHISTRLHQLSLAALKFAVNLLCWDQTDEFPTSIIRQHFRFNSDLQVQTFQTILFNDETHTYDGVIRALKLAIDCSSTQATRLATIVDREGRAIVRTGSRDICEQVKQSIEDRTRKESNRRTQKSGPLLVKVYQSSLSALQNFSVRLLQWLSAQAQDFPPLAPIISESLLYGCPECEQITPFGRSRQGRLDKYCQCQMETNAVFLMLFDRRLWKSARTAFHQLLMSTILMDMEHKHLFGRLLVQKYGIIFEDFIDDDHDHSVSITSMTVQIFTVPTIAKRLIIEEDALHVCVKKLRDHCHRYMNVSPHNEKLRQMDFTNDPYPAVLKRALYILNDVGYLLTLVPKESEWTGDLRQKFVHGSNTLLRFLADLQNMDEVKRQAAEHQLMESEWETAFNIFLRLQEPISLILAWARTDPAVHIQLYRLALMQLKLKTALMPEFNTERVKIEVNGHSAYAIPFDVARRPVSIHQPLWRFIGGLFCAPDSILRHYSVDESHDNLINIFDNPPNSKTVPVLPDEPINLKGVRSLLMEMPLRVLVLNAQAGAAQLWRRNGFSLVNQIHNYSSNLCRTEMFDRDIHLLQAIGAVMEPNKFLIRILDRFGLTKWAEIGFEDLPNSTYSMDGSTQEESSKIFTVIAEEMVHLLIMLLGERYSIGLSEEATPQKALEREIVHLLCTGPKPFSYIEKYVPNDPTIQRISLENAVRNVGDFRRPTTVTGGQFHLKESLRTEFNPFFWHYSKHLASLAEQQQNKERASLSRDAKACHPPLPPPFARFFAPLLKIMESEVFAKLMRVIVERMCKRSRFVSDGLFHRALFLLGMSLNEQRRAHEEGREFKFLQMALSEGIFDVLERMFDKPEMEMHNDLLWWIIKTYKHVASLYSKIKAEKVHDKDTTEKKREMGAAQRTAIAARKRQLAMERMRQLQNSFKTQNINQIDSITADQESQDGVATLYENEPAILSSDAGFPVCCGVAKSAVQLRAQPTVMCVLCQEDEAISFDGNPIVCSAFVQNSRLFTKKCIDKDDSIDKSSGDNLNIFSPINLPNELHVSTCSHLMHYSCYNVFIQSMNARERSRYRPHLLNARMLNTESGEYLCPLCKRLSNCVIPVYPPVQTLKELMGYSEDRPATVESFNDWVKALSTLVTQPFSPPKPVTKGHSRKRSHSERSLADLAKSASSSQNGSEGGGAPSSSSMTGAGVLPSSVASLPSSFEAIPMPEANLEGRRSSSSISSISDAIVGQIQAIEPMLNEGGSAIVQQLLTYVFGGYSGKKASPKSIDQTNVPSFIPHWQTMKPLLGVMDKIGTTEMDIPLPFFPRNRQEKTSIFGRFSEAINVLKACSFLVRSISTVVEAEKKPLFGAFNTRQRDCLNAFVRLSQMIPLNCQPSGLRVLISRLLSPLLAPPFCEKPIKNVGEHRKLDKIGTSIEMDLPLPFFARNRKTISPSRPTFPPQNQLDQALGSEVGIMQIDMLTLAIELVFCIGWSWSDGKRVLHNTNTADSKYKVADGSVDELYAMHLTLIAHLFQVIIAFDPPEYPFMDDKEVTKYFPESKENTEADAEETEVGKEPIDFAAVMGRIRALFPQRRWQFSHGNELHLYNTLHSAAIAFLRPLVLVYNAITLVPPPESLKDPSIVDNFVPLCRYLGLPSTIVELLSGPEVERLFQMWSQHTIPANISLCLPQLPLKLNQLIELPEDFSQLINMAVNFRCPQVEETTTTIPTLCLSCGEMLCSQGYCCQRTINDKIVGACTYHLSKCHSSTGIFLRIRECQLLLFYVAADVSRGCFKPAPYVDEFGETDPGFRRGNPMHLNKELYSKIRRQWLHQEVAEEVINQYELNHRNLAYEWQLF